MVTHQSDVLGHRSDVCILRALAITEGNLEQRLLQKACCVIGTNSHTGQLRRRNGSSALYSKCSSNVPRSSRIILRSTECHTRTVNSSNAAAANAFGHHRDLPEAAHILLDRYDALWKAEPLLFFADTNEPQLLEVIGRAVRRFVMTIQWDT